MYSHGKATLNVNLTLIVTIYTCVYIVGYKNDIQVFHYISWLVFCE